MKQVPFLEPFGAFPRLKNPRTRALAAIEFLCSEASVMAGCLHPDEADQQREYIAEMRRELRRLARTLPGGVSSRRV
jgi:uncharacterized NAD-dependent epimerase/dehydratase family protein